MDPLVTEHTEWKGTIRVGEGTKDVLGRAQQGDLVLLAQDDLDETIADRLCEAGVAAIINAGRTMTGKFPHEGPFRLLHAGIPIFEIDCRLTGQIRNGETVYVSEDVLQCSQGVLPCTLLTAPMLLPVYQAAQYNYRNLLRAFVDNTLHYAQQEQTQLLEPLYIPPLRVLMYGRDVLVVSRGKDSQDDLLAMARYVSANKPIVVAVDGGADVVLAQGYVPDLIVGDMEHVSNAALRCGAQLLVHSYADGRSPGLYRTQRLLLPAEAVYAPGTSEDAALRIAYEQGAYRIIAIGLHSDAVDFMARGRQGMASTLLLRMMIGHRLIDVRGTAFLAARAGKEKLPSMLGSWRAT